MRLHLLVLLSLLWFAAPAAAQWSVLVNGGQPVTAQAGAVSTFEFAVTRSAQPAATLSGGLYADRSLFQVGPLAGPRCVIDEISFLPPPGLLTTVTVRDVQPAETVRCSIELQVARGVAPGSHTVIFFDGVTSSSFQVHVGLGTTVRAIPATDGATLAALLLALFGAVVRRRR